MWWLHFPPLLQLQQLHLLPLICALNVMRMTVCQQCTSVTSAHLTSVNFTPMRTTKLGQPRGTHYSLSLNHPLSPLLPHHPHHPDMSAPNIQVIILCLCTCIYT